VATAAGGGFRIRLRGFLAGGSAMSADRTEIPAGSVELLPLRFFLGRGFSDASSDVLFFEEGRRGMGIPFHFLTRSRWKPSSPIAIASYVTLQFADDGLMSRRDLVVPAFQRCESEPETLSKT
jgi:hypothetical protein